MGEWLRFDWSVQAGKIRFRFAIRPTIYDLDGETRLLVGVWFSGRGGRDVMLFRSHRDVAAGDKRFRWSVQRWSAV